MKFKIKKFSNLFTELQEIHLELLVLLPAFPAINRSAFCRLERNFALSSAIRAFSLMHFSRAAEVSFSSKASFSECHLFHLFELDNVQKN
jgi:hypothetical protein